MFINNDTKKKNKENAKKIKHSNLNNIKGSKSSTEKSLIYLVK